MRCRQYFVIYLVGEERDREHSRTRDQFESMRVLDSLLKAGIKAYARKEYF